MSSISRYKCRLHRTHTVISLALRLSVGLLLKFLSRFDVKPKNQTGPAYRTFITRFARLSQLNWETENVLQQAISVKILLMSLEFGHWDPNDCCCMWILWSCTTNCWTLTYTTELCKEHDTRHDTTLSFWTFLWLLQLTQRRNEGSLSCSWS